jgi:hypothetical protein
MKRQPINKTEPLKSVMFLTVLFCVLLLVETGCTGNITENCSSIQQAYIGKVDGSKTGNINQDISFTVYFGINSGCGKYGSITETVSGNTRTVSVNAKYEGCACTAMAGVITTNYIFKTSQAGIYYFKFSQGNNSFIIDTLTIQ